MCWHHLTANRPNVESARSGATPNIPQVAPDAKHGGKLFGEV